MICFITDRPLQSFPTTLSFTFFPSFKRLGYFLSISCTTLAWSAATAAAATPAAESAPPGSFFSLAGGEIFVEWPLAADKSMLVVVASRQTSPARDDSSFLGRFAGGGGGLGVVAEEDGPDGEADFAALALVVAGRPRFLAGDVSVMASGDLRVITLPLLDLIVWVPADVSAVCCFSCST